MVSALPPLADRDAEEAVLSTLLLDAERYREVSAVVRGRHFFFDANRRVFSAIEALIAEKKPVDLVQIATHLRATGRLDDVGGTPYLAELIDATPSVANVTEHAKIVADFARRRHIATEAERLAVRARGGETTDTLVDEITRLAERTQPDQSHIRLTTLERAIQEPDEPIPWVWTERHLVATGRPTIVAAYGGTGKTWLVLVMALSVATGIPFLGAPPAKQGKAIVLEYETGSRRLLRRLRRLVHGYGIGGGLDDLVFAAQEDLGIWLTSPDAEEELVRLCAGAVLLVVDSLIQGSPGLRENDAEMAGPLHMLARVSARTSCAVAVIHHERKTTQDQAGGAGQSLRGHSAIQAGCDAIWRLARAGEIVEMRATKVSDGRHPQGWDLRILDTDGGGVVIDANDAVEAVPPASIDDRVAETVRERPGRSGREVRVAVGGRRDAVSDALTRLELAGTIESRPGPRNSTTWWPTVGAGS